MIPLLDAKRLELVARNRSIKVKIGESVGKLLTAFIRKADEGSVGKLIIEVANLLSTEGMQTEIRFSVRQPRSAESIPTPWLLR